MSKNVMSKNNKAKAKPTTQKPFISVKPVPSPADLEGRRCGFVAVIGVPNAGKSTLVNALVGAKVAIVSHKVQTTRVPLRGIAIDGKSQIIFIDTPGIFAPKRRLDKAMVEAAWGGTQDADVVALLVDASKGLTPEVKSILAALPNTKSKRFLVLNKIDWVDEKERLLGHATEITALQKFDQVFMISALDGDGVADLKSHLARIVPEGPWHYPEDDISDAPLRQLASEITREKIYHWLHEELPYATTVETTDWQDFKNGSVRIEQTIYVERDSQKSIVLGKGGETIKRLSSESRSEMARLLERPVHLFLFVKVRENWGSDPERYRQMGLEFPKD